MSSRFPPNVGENRYARDRSPPRYDRHLASDGRASDQGYERNDSYSGRGAPLREPPRGPKAQTVRRSFAGRGRGFAGRGDGRDRDFREESFSRGRGRGQDREPRDRYDARDRRPSPSARTRSRSPYRDLRDADPTLRRRSSRDGPLPSTDLFASRGRGSYRGRGRGDWEHTKGKSFYSEERGYDQRNYTKDQQWDSPARDHNADPNRCDEDARTEKERGREERLKSEQIPYRPDSRNSIAASRSTSTTSIPPNLHDHVSQAVRNAPDANFDSEKRPALVENRADKEVHGKGIDRLDTSHRHIEIDRQGSRASSPPPATSVPAFGSALPQAAKSQEALAKPASVKEEETQIHPSRRALLEPTKEASLPSSNVLKAPTAFSQYSASRRTARANLKLEQTLPSSNCSIRAAFIKRRTAICEESS